MRRQFRRYRSRGRCTSRASCLLSRHGSPPLERDEPRSGGTVASSRGRRPLAARAAALAGDGVTARAVVKVGVAWEEIVRLAAEEHADMIVMGTQGRTGLDRLLLGSVAERVIRQAPCPVLTVRPEIDNQE